MNVVLNPLFGRYFGPILALISIVLTASQVTWLTMALVTFQERPCTDPCEDPCGDNDICGMW